MEETVIHKISEKSNRYGDKLIELMDRCDAPNLQAVPESVAIEYLNELIENERNQPHENHIVYG